MDVSNLQAVSMRGEEILVLAPRRSMTKQEALIHAAWLVVLAGGEDEFLSVLREVQST